MMSLFPGIAWQPKKSGTCDDADVKETVMPRANEPPLQVQTVLRCYVLSALAIYTFLA